MNGWVRTEASELNPEREDPEMPWTGCAVVLTENGILTHYGLRIIPKQPTV